MGDQRLRSDHDLGVLDRVGRSEGGKDPREEIARRLMNQHTLAGKTTAEVRALAEEAWREACATIELWRSWNETPEHARTIRAVFAELKSRAR